jgi:pimeloyl-ACP methyl ester carboxylesterase
MARRVQQRAGRRGPYPPQISRSCDGRGGPPDDAPATLGEDGAVQEATTQPPTWFTSALATRPRDGFVEVEGARIHHLSWGDRSAPGLLLVHGGAAHAYWWSFLAPQLTHDYHVAAVDLSGHGDSGHRADYGMETWAEEVMAVADDLGMTRPIVIGHSMGGFVSIVAAALYGERLAGTIVVDSPVRRADPETDEGQRGRAFRNPKVYPSLDEAVRHFHLIPPQPCSNDYIVEHVARHSLKQTADGWSWKFDPGVFGQRSSQRGTHDYLAQIRGRIAVLHGQYSAIVTEDVIDYMNELLGRTAPVVEIPQAHHHLLLDQPLAFIAAIRALLADWTHSVPRARPVG